MIKNATKRRRLPISREIHLDAQMNEISDKDWNDALNLCADLMDDTRLHIHDITIMRGENGVGVLKLYSLRIDYLIKCIRKASKMMKVAYPMDVNIVNPKYG